MARITFLHFERVSRNEDGCTCDRCGQWIKNIWTVRFDDGITAHFGVDCYEQMCKESRLTNYGMKLMKKLMKELEWWEEKLIEFEGMTEEKCLAYQCEQANSESYYYGRTFEEYKQDWIDIIKNDRIPRVINELAKFKNVNFQR